MSLQSLLTENAVKPSDLSPIESDPRYLSLLKDYKYKVSQSKNVYIAQLTALLSVVTAPLHAISISMQLSVIPHLTAYGDVKPSEVYKKGVVRTKLEGIGLLESKAKPAETTAVLNEVKHDLMQMPKEARADLMKASGQVGNLFIRKITRFRPQQTLSSAGLPELLGVRPGLVPPGRPRLLQGQRGESGACLPLPDPKKRLPILFRLRGEHLQEEFLLPGLRRGHGGRHIPAPASPRRVAARPAEQAAQLPNLQKSVDHVYDLLQRTPQGRDRAHPPELPPLDE
jgi:hypothetical protein